MKLINYFYVKPDKMVDEKKARVISATDGLRDKYMSDVFWKLYGKQIKEKIQPKGKTAFLYPTGNVSHHSNTRELHSVARIPESTKSILSQAGYTISKLAHRFSNIEYLNTNNNTCASSHYSIHEAQKLLNDGYDDVIVYAEEWYEDIELSLFDSLDIDVICSDGLAVLHFSNSGDSIAEVSDIKSAWNRDGSPFTVTSKGYDKVITYGDYDIVKMHGTGTPQNDDAENSAINEQLGNVARFSIKDEIGHSQGASTALELCMLLSETKHDNVLCLTSGLGNFYGGFKVRRS